MSNLTIEETRALYFDINALITSPKSLYRLNHYSGGRFYYSNQKDGSIKYYISVTNMIEKTMPTPYYLVKWISDMGYQKAQEYKNERADYGTFMHIVFSQILIERQFNFDELDDSLKGYLSEISRDEKFCDFWIDDLKKDIIGYCQWIIDYNVEPLMIEQVLSSDDGYAGAVDFLGYIDMESKGYFGEVYKTNCKGGKKGDPKMSKMTKRVLAIVDNKSGRKGFYETHEIQLEAYRRLVKENFPQFKDEEIYIFNYSPRDWRTQPSYHFKDQSNAQSIAKFEHLANIGKMELQNLNREVTEISGMINIDALINGDTSLEDNFLKMTMDDYVKNALKDSER